MLKGDSCGFLIAFYMGELLKGEVLGSRSTNNLIIELVRTYKRAVGVGALQCCESGVYGTGCHKIVYREKCIK